MQLFLRNHSHNDQNQQNAIAPCEKDVQALTELDSQKIPVETILKEKKHFIQTTTVF